MASLLERKFCLLNHVGAEHYRPGRDGARRFLPRELRWPSACASLSMTSFGVPSPGSSTPLCSSGLRGLLGYHALVGGRFEVHVTSERDGICEGKYVRRTTA